MATDLFVWDEDKRVANLRKHGVDFVSRSNSISPQLQPLSMTEGTMVKFDIVPWVRSAGEST